MLICVHLLQCYNKLTNFRRRTYQLEILFRADEWPGRIECPRLHSLVHHTPDLQAAKQDMCVDACRLITDSPSDVLGLFRTKGKESAALAHAGANPSRAEAAMIAVVPPLASVSLDQSVDADIVQTSFGGANRGCGQ